MYALAWIALLAPQTAPAAGTPKPQARPPAAQVVSLAPLAADEAARAGETSLSFAELDELLIARRSQGVEGREVLKHLLDTKVLAQLAAESRMEITPTELDAKVKEFEAEIVKAGQAASLKQFLDQSGVALDVFRDHLRLSMVQEALARRALGTPATEKLNGEKQEMWLAQVLQQRGAQLPPPPWTDGIAARCGDLEVKAKDYLEYLHLLLPPENVRDDCYQLLLQKRARARMPDLSTEALDRAVEAELGRRRHDFALDPKYRGTTYEQVMGAQGLQAAYLKKDPALVIAALATLWVDRTNADAALRAASAKEREKRAASSSAERESFDRANADAGLLDVYTKEREYFDGRYGEAIDARMIFLRASDLPNPLIPRDFNAADKELSEWKSSCKTVDDFENLALRHSEENGTREQRGRVGFVTRADERLPKEVREALFNAKPAADGSAVAGPLRLPSGSCLLWVGLRRPAPGWAEMSANVHRELRKRFLDELLKREVVRTYLDKH